MDDSTDEDVLREQTERLADLVARLGGSNVQTVIHKQAGPGGLLAAAITACFCTLILLVIVVFLWQRDIDRIEAQIRDHQAWIGVYGNDLAKLKAERKNEGR
jgi:hypothetical protein